MTALAGWIAFCRWIFWSGEIISLPLMLRRLIACLVLLTGLAAGAPVQAHGVEMLGSRTEACSSADQAQPAKGQPSATKQRRQARRTAAPTTNWLGRLLLQRRGGVALGSDRALE